MVTGAGADVGSFLFLTLFDVLVPRCLSVPHSQGLPFHPTDLCLLLVQPLFPLQQLLGMVTPLHQLLLPLCQEPGEGGSQNEGEKKNGEMRKEWKKRLKREIVGDGIKKGATN